MSLEAQPMKTGRGLSPLVTTEWLAAHLSDPHLRVVDVRWRSRFENGRGISFDDHEGYLSGHIPGAVFAGMIADLSDPHHAVPDMLTLAIFNIFPTALQLVFICALLWIQLNVWFTVITVLMIAAYAYFTFALTRWRMRQRVVG